MTSRRRNVQALRAGLGYLRSLPPQTAGSRLSAYSGLAAKICAPLRFPHGGVETWLGCEMATVDGDQSFCIGKEHQRIRQFSRSAENQRLSEAASVFVDCAADLRTE